MSQQDQTDLTELDDETLMGHYLIAGMDQRLEDHRLLGDECVRRGLASSESHALSQKRLQAQGEKLRLSRPILAHPDR